MSYFGSPHPYQQQQQQQPSQQQQQQQQYPPPGFTPFQQPPFQNPQPASPFQQPPNGNGLNVSNFGFPGIGGAVSPQYLNIQIGMGYGLTGGLPPPTPTSLPHSHSNPNSAHIQQYLPPTLPSSHSNPNSSSELILPTPPPHHQPGSIRWPTHNANLPAGTSWDAPPTYQQHIQKQQGEQGGQSPSPTSNPNQFYQAPQQQTSPTTKHQHSPLSVSDPPIHPHPHTPLHIHPIQHVGSAGSFLKHPPLKMRIQNVPGNSASGPITPSTTSPSNSASDLTVASYYPLPPQLSPQPQPKQSSFIPSLQQQHQPPSPIQQPHLAFSSPHIMPQSEPKTMSSSLPVLPGYPPLQTPNYTSQQQQQQQQQQPQQRSPQWGGDLDPRSQFGKQGSNPQMLQESGEGYMKPLPTPPSFADETRKQLLTRNRSMSLGPTNTLPPEVQITLPVSPLGIKKSSDTPPPQSFQPSNPGPTPDWPAPGPVPVPGRPMGGGRGGSLLLPPKTRPNPNLKREPRVGSIMMHVVKDSASIVLPYDKRARKAVFQALLQQISTGEETRAQISLSRSRLTTKEVKNLCDALSRNSCVISLDLSLKGLAGGETEAITLANWLMSNKTLTWLDLKSNDLGGRAFKAFEEALQKNTLLTRLDIYEASSSNPTKNDQNKERLKAIDRYISHNRNFEMFRQGSYRKLELPSRELVDMPVKFTTSFVNTTIIDLSYNHLRYLPPEITTLFNLEELNVSYNEIYELPEDVGKLTQMDLQHNKLSRLPLSVKDLTLHTLLLSDNSFITLPVFLAHMHSLRTLTVQGNPLPDLPREIGSSSTALLGYLHQLTMGMKTCYKMRIALVGTQGSGKSTLAALLMNDKKKLPPSGRQQSVLVGEGIEIHEWLVKPPQLKSEEKIEFSFWDFPGNNDASLSTHHFFLGERVIYLLIFNILDSDQPDQIENWIQSIECTGKKAPVILVATHCDDKQCTGDYIEKTFDSIVTRAARFKPIEICFAVSCKVGKGVDDLREEIIKLALKQTGMPQSFPNAYSRLETHIKKLAQSSLNEGHLSWEDYRRIAISSGLQEESIFSATMLFCEMGLLWFYPDVDSNVVVFQPRWLTKMFAEIVNVANDTREGSSISRIGEREKRQLFKQAVVDETELKKIWGPVEYPERVHGFLVGLLEKLEIVYKLDDGKIFVPSLLANERTKKGLTTNVYWPPFDTTVKQISRHYNFEYLPYRFFRRVIVRFLHSLDWQPLDCWVNGALLLKDDIKVLLEVNPSKRSLKVSVRGIHPQKNFSVLIDNIDTLITDWLQVAVQISIPCTHCIAESSYDPFMFPLRTLETAFSNGDNMVLCRETKPVLISELAPDVTMSGFDVRWITMGELKMEQELGIGGHAKVYKAAYNNTTVAVKKMLQASAGDIAAPETLEVFDEFRREASLMSVLKHPNVVALIGVVMDPFCMVLEFMSLGSLFNIIHEDTIEMNWKHRISISEDIASGMAFLHHFKPPIIHRDLKSPNILLAMKGQQLVAKVADFGLSRKLLLANALQSKVVDNPIWLAPEIMRKEKYTEKVDVYSFGVILWELLTKDNFFGEIGFLAGIEDAVKEGRRPDIPLCPVEDYATLLSECWANDAARRPSFDKVLKRLKLMSTHRAVVTAAATPLIAQKTEATPYNGALQTRTSVMFSHPVISSTPVRKVIVLNDYVSQADNEVSLQEGDIIQVYNDSEEWWEGENLSSGERGWFPPPYVKNYYGNGITSELSPIPARRQQPQTPAPVQEETTLLPVSLSISPPKILPQLEKLKLVTPGGGDIPVGGTRPRSTSTSPPIEGATFVKKLGPHTASVQCMCKLNHNVWSGTSDGSITLWDVDCYEMISTQTCHSGRIQALLVVDQYVWSASKDSTIKVWTLKNGIDLRELAELRGHTDEVTCLLEVGKYVWSGSLDKTIKIWNKKTKRGKKSIKLHNNHAVVSMLLQDDIVFAGSDRLIFRFNTSTFKLLDSFEAHSGMIHSLILVREKLWSCSSDQTIKIWDPKTMECSHTIQGHHTRVFSLVFDGLSVWSGGWDKTIMLWNSRTNEFIRQVESTGARQHNDAISCLLFVSKTTSPSSPYPSSSSSSPTAPTRHIWSSSWDKTICVWTPTSEQVSPRSCISRGTVILPSHHPLQHSGHIPGAGAGPGGAGIGGGGAGIGGAPTYGIRNPQDLTNRPRSRTIAN